MHWPRASVVTRPQARPTQIVRWPSASKEGIETRAGLDLGLTRRSSVDLFRRVLAARHRRVDAGSRQDARRPPGLRRARSLRRRSCSSAPRLRQERVQRACPASLAIDTTASASVTIVTTIVARRAASAGVSATSAPRSTRSRVASRSRFQTIVGIPARKALVAIAWPIVPMPRNATGSLAGVIILSLSSRRRTPGVRSRNIGGAWNLNRNDQVDQIVGTCTVRVDARAAIQHRQGLGLGARAPTMGLKVIAAGIPPDWVAARLVRQRALDQHHRGK